MFDLANDRLGYSDLLRPDVGYTLDFAVGMTYSLDLEALLGVPVALGLPEAEEAGSLRNPLCILEAIRKSADRIALFCNAGCIKLPQKIMSVHSLLENSVFQVRLGRNGNFHPKVWVLKYSRDGHESYIKLIVMSRNLTFDSSIDISASLCGIVGKETFEKNRPLADFIQYVAQYAGRKKQQVLSLAESVLKVEKFDVSHPFKDYDFYPIGIPGYEGKNNPVLGKKDTLFAVSPFLSDGIVEKMTSFHTQRKTLVTRKESVTEAVMNAFEHVYVTKDELSDNEYGAKQDIHAKIYYVSTNIGNYLYLGSANASENAFSRNIECLLRLTYKPYTMGYKVFSDDFIPEKNCPYVELKCVPQKTPKDENQDIIEKALREAVYAMKRGTISRDGDRYTITVNARRIKSEIRVQIAPLQRDGLVKTLEENNVFSGMLLRELSEFFVLSAGEQKLIVKIPLSGMPKDRDQAIYRSVIDNNNKFLNYLTFVLAADSPELYSELEESESLDLLKGTESQTFKPAFAVYEQMLKTVHQNPSRLKDISDMITRLDPGVVGEAFLKMFRQFEAAGKKVRR